MLETLQHYRHEGHTFVAMPDHLHGLLTPKDTTLERGMQMIKVDFSHRLGSKLPVWLRAYTEQNMRTPEEFVSRRDYIKVRVRLCRQPEDFPYFFA